MTGEPSSRRNTFDGLRSQCTAPRRGATRVPGRAEAEVKADPFAERNHHRQPDRFVNRSRLRGRGRNQEPRHRRRIGAEPRRAPGPRTREQVGEGHAVSSSMAYSTDIHREVPGRAPARCPDAGSRRAREFRAQPLRPLRADHAERLHRTAFARIGPACAIHDTHAALAEDVFDQIRPNPLRYVHCSRRAFACRLLRTCLTALLSSLPGHEHLEALTRLARC